MVSLFLSLFNSPLLFGKKWQFLALLELPHSYIPDSSPNFFSVNLDIYKYTIMQILINHFKNKNFIEANNT